MQKHTGGRGRIACTPAKQDWLLRLIARGWSTAGAARSVGISDRAVTRQASRDVEFRRRLDEALAARRARRPVAVHR